MADKKLFLTAKGVGRYATRMLKAGDEITLSGPKARLYEGMKWASAEKPTAEEIAAAPTTIAPPARPSRATAQAKAPAKRKPAAKRSAKKSTAKAKPAAKPATDDSAK